MQRSISAVCGASANFCPCPIPAEHVITLREGNTPLYEIPHSSRYNRCIASVRQTSRHEPYGLVQRCGHDGGRHLRAPGRIPLGGLRLNRQYIGVNGGLCRAGRHAQPGSCARRKNFLEQTLAGSRLRRAHLPAAHRLRRLPTPAAGTRSPRARLPTEFHQSVSVGRPENSRARIDGATRLATARPHHRPRREPRQ